MELKIKILSTFCLLAIWLPACHPANHDHSKSRSVSFNGHSYDVYAATYPVDHIRMYWKDNKGIKLRSLDNLEKYVKSTRKTLEFATNGGMYMENNYPLGLYIENGKERSHINLSQKGKGNFYLQPNGVFMLTDSMAMILTTDSFKWVKNKAVYATQSGPMLVIDGEINKVFTKGSPNTNIRSGVGIGENGKVVFAISDEAVNFYDFAQLFKESLKCKNALFLDGTISKMYLPALERDDIGGDFGVMIGVEK
jgi:uncharacterized protein YigE (DUF2233 family)